MITHFRGKYFFLSNFYPSPVEHLGKVFPTVEHAYQASKHIDPVWQEQVRCAPSPGKAKRLGRDVKLRANWEENKLNVMTRLVRKKFKDPALRVLLLETGSQELIETNYWNDTFWGVCNGVGSNHLGNILMRRRAKIQELVALKLKSFK